MKQPVDIIKDARDILADPGKWCQGDYSDSDGRVCLLGALGVAFNGDCEAYEYRYDALIKAAKLIRSHMPGEVFLVSLFNDDQHTTHADILNVFDKTLADLGAL